MENLCKTFKNKSHPQSLPQSHPQNNPKLLTLYLNSRFNAAG